MANMHPQKPTFSNYTEQYVFESIEKAFPQEYHCYFNYYADIREFDIAIMVPYKGIAILEIKAWTVDKIVKIINNRWVEYLTNNNQQLVLLSPYEQAREYTYKLREILSTKVDSRIVVLPTACLPNITKKQYEDKRLDLISPMPFTILQDDFLSSDGIKKKIEFMFDQSERVYRLNPRYFTNEMLLKAREIFETKEQIEESIKNNEELRQFYMQFKKEYYSILKYIPSSAEMDDVKIAINSMLDHWQVGTKLIVITDSDQIQSTLADELAKRLKKISLSKHFGRSVFNMKIYKIESCLGDAFEIFDGDYMDVFQYRRQLRKTHSECDFNLNQYRIEHCNSDKNLVVRAGAGSGKTFSMISRIMYLIHMQKMIAEDLVEKIFLITFTNEAARNMMDRLKIELQEYYLVTRDYRYFEMIDAVEDMRITTIHSLSKKILQKYAYLLGYGKDLSIVSGKHERKNVLKKELNDYIATTMKDRDKLKRYKMSMYNIQSVMETFLEKIENKNIDILRTSLDFDNQSHFEFNKLIETVIINSEKLLRKELNDNNNIRLSDIIIKLRELIGSLGELSKNQIKSQVQYVFIDEFQDTDDVQIELIQGFRELLDFKLFIVGDIKQCIYRFRGAEENAFDRMIGVTDLKWNRFTLNKNYRTDQWLLKSYEKQFEEWTNQGKFAYNAYSDKLTSRILLNQKEDDFFRHVEIKSNSDENEFKSVFMKELNEHFALMPKGEVLVVLVRDNIEVERIVKLAADQGVTIESDKGYGLYSIDPTLDFYKLVVALQNNNSQRHLFNLYQTCYTNRKMPIKQIYVLRKNADKQVKTFMLNPPIKGWENYITDLKKEPVLKVLRELVVNVKPWINYGQRHNSGDYAGYYKRNLDLLFEKLSTISKTDYLTINKIEQILKIMIVTNQKEESRPLNSTKEHDKIIKCMTVHKSKGLEFHTVMLPLTHRNLGDQKRSGPYDFLLLREGQHVRVGYSIQEDETKRRKKNRYYQEEQEMEMKYKINEEVRILYVAITRAKKTLVTFTYSDTKNDESWQNYLCVRNEA